MNFEDIKLEKDPTIIFMGTPDFSVPILKGIMEHYKVRAIVTQPDRKVGRDGKVIFSPVKQVAFDNDILCLQPEKIRDILQDINVLEPDLIITCAYGQILPLEMLQIPRLGCINVHASLLPKLRGGAPIHHAIMDGFSKTGVTIMYMDKGMDTGDIISQREIPISNDDTAETLHDKLSVLGRDLLLETLPSILNGTNSRTSQDEAEATYGFNITREDEHIDFSKTKRQIVNKVRGLNSWPGAYCILDDKILKVWKCREGERIYDLGTDGEITRIYDDGFGVKTSNGEVVFTEVQLEGKRKMAAKDFINGYHEKLEGKILR
ncbi:MAG TPA: methionyl-tRNA formyltransferase [Candidatus Coprosoma intestinipullorum]|uniref:Methionyl-tRNA formyltransferase n=1 Tax=Candidatus Coprosoma intestinipullorum TaxID=2840752 RepID=A0A9D0ZQW7_9FIRM|nr:methionyl-tRNA formyltransferase [Candidatus Coprosoma intestinipullorum]